MKKLFAFTLAETLIVMGIIGIVSALTLPNLNSSTGEKEKIAKVKKIYQNLDDAVGRAQAVYGPMDEWFINDKSVDAQEAHFGERIADFLKVSKTCNKTSGIKKCFPTDTLSYSFATEEENTWTTEGNFAVVLADGTGLSVKIHSNNTFRIFYDIDGVNKGQSKWGKDLFLLYADSNGVAPEIMADNVAPCGVNGDDCTAWVITNENMDYANTKDGKTCTNNTSRKITWGGNTSCK